MQLKSSVFANNGSVPQKYTCEGEGLMPPLEISDVPEGTQSLAIIVDDPDAPVGLFTHWVACNIPPQTASLTSENLPVGIVLGKTSVGRVGWVAPCPPRGTGVHRYQFHLYALHSMLNVSEGVGRQEIEDKIAQTTLAKAELVGTYQNSNN